MVASPTYLYGLAAWFLARFFFLPVVLLLLAAVVLAVWPGTQIGGTRLAVYIIGSKLGNGRFLSAPEVSVSQPKLNGYGLMSEVW